MPLWLNWVACGGIVPAPLRYPGCPVANCEPGHEVEYVVVGRVALQAHGHVLRNPLPARPDPSSRTAAGPPRGPLAIW